ncbi:TGBp1 family protein [Nocardia araoensis]|uniref:TGBp1 family protein n=1 Tax=Nocardia araoensis TaxID=228600 RepID=UPI001FE233DF|nr:TGBp1 family protein [Nocardia araoensis]
MNPPLEAVPGHATEPRLPILVPDALHDLRGRAFAEIRYPAAAALIIAGVPGAGKSTALRKFFDADAAATAPSRSPAGVLVLDSMQARNRWRRKLWWLPYLLWRPVVHAAHFLAIRTALREVDGPIVIHDCATFRWARTMIAGWAAQRELHLLLLDVPAPVAKAGQHSRGRRINHMAFRLHVRGWRRLMSAVTTERAARGSRSVVIVDRAAVDHLRCVTFA